MPVQVLGRKILKRSTLGIPSQGFVFGLAVRMLERVSHIGCLGLDAAPATDCSFLLIRTLGDSSDYWSTWIPDTHMGHLDCVSVPGFDPSPATAIEGIWE